MADARFAGKEISLGDLKLVVPAISLGKLKALQPRLAKLDLSGGMPSPDDLDTIVDMALAALQRNYPEMTREDLEDLIDLGNMKQVIDAVAGQSGLEPSGKPELEGTTAP